MVSKRGSDFLVTERVVLSIDQGTTGTTVLVVDGGGTVLSRGYAPVTQHYPQPGWVEHDPRELWQTVLDASAQALALLPGARPAALGITNQRETTIVWDRRSGEPLAPAIVWQCRRTAARCDALRAAGLTESCARRTGLVLDAYFSATKVEWLLQHLPGLRQRAADGEALFGTVDSWLLWHLTGGAVHATDITNASRTLLLDVESGTWSPEMLELFGVPEAMLPRVVPSSGMVGETVATGAIPGGVPIAGVAGDQQAALFGQACYAPGEAKTTYGTGCFLLLNAGERRPHSRHQLLSTIAWQLGPAQPLVYALEGSVFNGGTVVQWLRDELGLIATAAESEALAASVPDSGGVSLVPAFTGLGAPYWDGEARGAILGLTRGTTRAHLVRAGLEGIAHQVADVVAAMEADAGTSLRQMNVDGGAAANDFLMQFQADLLGRPVVRPANLETTAFGAAYLAGLATGVWPGPQALQSTRRVERRFEPAMTESTRARLRAGWRAAVERVRSTTTP
ncbi:MAG TPA: glycerol kinase GlpK [Chloroflexota bacterium]|nr:glycerol kinase GlpK [Chloroflexota bacterium]